MVESRRMSGTPLLPWGRAKAGDLGTAGFGAGLGTAAALAGRPGPAVEGDGTGARGSTCRVVCGLATSLRSGFGGSAAFCKANRPRMASRHALACCVTPWPSPLKATPFWTKSSRYGWLFGDDAGDPVEFDVYTDVDEYVWTPLHFATDCRGRWLD